MARLAEDHPHIVTVVDYGETREKRALSLLKVKHGLQLRSEPAGVHVTFHEHLTSRLA